MSKRPLPLSILLTLGLSAAAGTPAGTVIRNVAYFDADGTTVPSNEIALTTAAVCGVALTPASQTASVQAGQAATVTFAVTNTGNAPFEFPLHLSMERGRASAVPAALTLAPEQQATVSVEVTPDPSATARATLSTACAGQADVTGVATVTSSSAPLSITKSVDKAGPVQPGETLTYTLTVTNPNPVPMTATVTDALDERLDVLQITPPSTRTEGGAAHWVLTVPAHGQRLIEIRVATPTNTDDAVIRNVAALDSLVQQATGSNAVTTVIYAPKLSIEKSADVKEGMVGQRVNYSLLVANVSLTATTPDVTVVDTLPRGLSAVEGTLSVGGQPATDLDPDPRVIRVKLGTLKAGASTKVTYQTLLNPQAAQSTEQINVARAGIGDALQAAVESRHHLRVHSAPTADVTGRVYVDHNRNGTFDPGIDTPVPGARIVMAGGQSVLTDARGDYHFAHLRAGRAALLLDPRSVQYAPASVPGDYLQSGARLVTLYHLSSVDFPLLPPTATASARRSTTVRLGDVTLHKMVTPTPGGFEVTWSLTSEQRRTVQVTDPLPEGAQLRGEAPGSVLTLTPGEVLRRTYQVTYAGTPEAMTTDPALTLLGGPQ